MCFFLFFGGEFLHQQGKRKEYYFTDAQFILFIKKSSIKTREILVFEEMLPLFHSLFIVWGGHFGIFRRKNWTKVFKVVFNEC